VSRGISATWLKRLGRIQNGSARYSATPRRQFDTLPSESVVRHWGRAQRALQNSPEGDGSELTAGSAPVDHVDFTAQPSRN
jgi:hypothetical protein